jgi:hypothetical protein
MKIGGVALAVLLVMGTTGGGLRAAYSAPSQTLSCAFPPGEGGATPDWDTVALRDCQMDCNWIYMGVDQRRYNICYTCGCLVDAAETPGELASAEAQCDFELRRR